MTQDNLQKLARAIATQEGFGVEGARPTRNHNPGDLRGWPGFPADAEGFTIFPDDRTGWNRLEMDVANHATRWPGQSLLSFIAGNDILSPASAVWPGYAPASDANDSAAYAQAIADALGCNVNTTFSEL